VPFVVGIFETADHRSGGADELREFTLRKASLGAQREDLASDLRVRSFLFEEGEHFGLSPEIPAV
jgi:hypothetical protein